MITTDVDSADIFDYRLLGVGGLIGVLIYRWVLIRVKLSYVRLTNVIIVNVFFDVFTWFWDRKINSVIFWLHLGIALEGWLVFLTFRFRGWDLWGMEDSTKLFDIRYVAFIKRLILIALWQLLKVLLMLLGIYYAFFLSQNSIFCKIIGFIRLQRAFVQFWLVQHWFLKLIVVFVWLIKNEPYFLLLWRVLAEFKWFWDTVYLLSIAFLGAILLLDFICHFAWLFRVLLELNLLTNLCFRGAVVELVLIFTEILLPWA